MNDKDLSQIEYLLGCIQNSKRADDLTKTLSSLYGTLTAVLENIGLSEPLSSMPENMHMLLAMVPELYRLVSLERCGSHPLLNTLQRAREYAHLQYVNAQYERVILLCLDDKYRLKECRICGEGGLRDVVFYPRRLLQEALSCGAHAVILCHNHPSDWAFFSESDVVATRELLVLFARMQLPLIDHLLVAGDRVSSMRSRAFISEKSWLACGEGMPSLAQWRAEDPPPR